MISAWLLIILLAGGAPADDAEAPVVTIPAAGHEWFSYVLAFPGWQGGAPEFLSSLEDAMEHPASTMIFCLGPADMLDVADIRPFVRNGGAVVIATENSAPRRLRSALDSLVGAIPTTIEARADSPDNPEHAYGGQAACPLAKGVLGHPWFFRQGKEYRPATNRPTVLMRARVGREAAGFAGRVVRDGLVPSDLLAASAEVEQGRAALLGDTGLFSNLMLQAPDNLPFAFNVVEWAREGPEGTRKRVLLIVEGEIIQKPFMPPLMIPPVPIPPPEKLLEALYKGAEGLVQGVEKGLADLDDRDALNQMTARIGNRGWIEFLGALGVVGFIGLIIRFLAGSTARSRFPAMAVPAKPAAPKASAWRRAGEYMRQTVSRLRSWGSRVIRT